MASYLNRDDPFYTEVARSSIPAIGLDRPLDQMRFPSVALADHESARQFTGSLLSADTHTVLGLNAVPGLSIAERRLHRSRRRAGANLPGKRAQSMIAPAAPG